MTQHDVPPITGTTLLVGAMGDPVAQVRAPAVFNRMFAELGVDGACVPLHVAPANLAAAMQGIRALPNMVGLSVTIPHKAAIIPLLDDISPQARRLGVVNAVRREPDGRLVGDIFDGEGFVGGLHAQKVPVKGQRAWLVGAGGAATSISFTLLDHGLAHLTLTDIVMEKAEALGARLLRDFPGQVVVAATADPQALDLAINATPLGLKPDDKLPFDPRLLPARVTVADVIMKPPTPRLLIEAESSGHRTHPGRHMLDNQVGLYAEFIGFRRFPRRA